MPRRIHVVLFVLLGMCVGAMSGQDKPVAPPAPSTSSAPAAPTPDDTAGPVNDGPMHTLHVYMDLIQVPVLVLDSDRERMKPIDPSRFLVSLDAGPNFRPKTVRQEGDDAITLGILIDVNSVPDLLPALAASVAGLAPGSLHPQDHITLYVMDCTLRRTLEDEPADPQRLRGGLDRALEDWNTRRKAKQHAPPCETKANLWDAMGYAMMKLGELPGRRVLLAITDGTDRGSGTQWDKLREFAQYKGVAVFGYRPKSDATLSQFNSLGGYSRSGRGSLPAGQLSTTSSGAEDPFNTICEQSGGIVLPAVSNSEPKDLARFVTLVRERYILEFSRPRTDDPGKHDINVTIQKSPLAYVRPAGVTILSAKRPDDDPDVIPRDTSDAPPVGTRKSLPKPH